MRGESCRRRRQKLVGPAIDKRAAVDLVYRKSPTNYSLIELKVCSDNPLFAAIEILMYGLLLVWSKEHVDELGYDLEKQPVLNAEMIMLSTLAPAKYYSSYRLKNVGSSLCDGLTKFGKNFG